MYLVSIASLFAITTKIHDLILFSLFFSLVNSTTLCRHLILLHAVIILYLKDTYLFLKFYQRFFLFCFEYN